MKIIKDTPKPGGARRLIIELEEGEDIRLVRRGQTAVIVEDGAFYKLGEPLHEDVFAGHILAGATPTTWDTLSQRWID
jgi:hypothetical protein